MASRDLLRKTMIEPARPEFRALFENLQGNILKSHARDHAVLIFFRIKRGKTGAARAAQERELVPPSHEGGDGASGGASRALDAREDGADLTAAARRFERLDREPALEEDGR